MIVGPTHTIKCIVLALRASRLLSYAEVRDLPGSARFATLMRSVTHPLPPLPLPWLPPSSHAPPPHARHAAPRHDAHGDALRLPHASRRLSSHARSSPRAWPSSKQQPSQPGSRCRCRRCCRGASHRPCCGWQAPARTQRPSPPTHAGGLRHAGIPCGGVCSRCRRGREREREGGWTWRSAAGPAGRGEGGRGGSRRRGWGDGWSGHGCRRGCGEGPKRWRSRRVEEVREWQEDDCAAAAAAAAAAATKKCRPCSHRCIWTGCGCPCCTCDTHTTSSSAATASGIQGGGGRSW